MADLRMRIPGRQLLLAAALGTAAAGCASTRPEAVDLPLRDVGACHGEHPAPAGGIDLAITLDVSQSARRPSGLDLDGDGRVGTFVDGGTSDPLDSRLAAQVAAVRTLVDALADADLRVAIVTMRGRTDSPTEGRETPLVNWQQGRIRTGLTDDAARVERALDAAIAERGQGRTDFSAGLRLAVRALVEGPEAEPPRRRAVFLLSDSADPIVDVAYPLNHPRLLSGGVQRMDHTMREAARDAIDAGAPVHTFGIGLPPTQEPNALTRIAGATGGRYHAVEDPGRLHCHLIAALAAR
ncbi:MAG: vWA domain-containing protein [Myxococcota bacterium]